MDRNIVYPGSIPLDSDILSINRNAMVAIGALMHTVLGINTVVDGLACTPTAPPTLNVVVGPGSITQLTSTDATNYGSLAADTTDQLVKMGISTASTTFTLPAPVSSGQAINYLIQASFSEYDTVPVVLPYYNAANPSLPYNGPANAGTAQYTDRVQRVAVNVVPGAPAATGTQVTPAPSAGYVPLYVITVFYGQTYIAGGSIVAHPLAPFVQYKLPTLSPGTSNMLVVASTQNYTPGQGVDLVRLRMVGGGGGGGAGGGGAGGGGAGAGSVEGFFPVTPGVPIACTVGAAGAAGGAGGSSSFGALAVASGGGGGTAGGTNSGGAGSTGNGAGSGGGLLISGRVGQAGFANSSFASSGAGGATSFGDGATGVTAAAGTSVAGQAAVLPGGGGAGGVGTGGGGAGAAGIIVLEW